MVIVKSSIILLFDIIMKTQGVKIMERYEQLANTYALIPHPEGGYFSEVYTAPYMYEEKREVGGSIYFMLVKKDISHFHQIDVDEIWYFHEGCGMRIHLIDEAGNISYEDLGAGEDQKFMVVIPRGVMFAAENLDENGYTFVSCATMPQFQYQGFRLIKKSEVSRYIPVDAEMDRLFMRDEQIDATVL